MRLLKWFRKTPTTKRFPQDYSKNEIVGLALYHWDEHIRLSTDLSNTRTKLIEAQKELSALKRQKK